VDAVKPPDDKAPREARRVWWVLGGAFVSLLLLILYIVFIYDCAPPEDAWLLPAPPPSASGPDPISALVAKDEASVGAMGNEWQKLSPEVREVAGSHVEEARTFVEKYRAELDDMHAFLKAHAGPLIFLESGQLYFYGGDNSGPNTLIWGANLISMEARLLARDGKYRESIEYSLRLVRLGKQLAGAGILSRQALVAVAIQAIGKSSLEDAANLHSFSAEEMQLMEDTLASAEIAPADFRACLQGEYRDFKREMADSRATAESFCRDVGLPLWIGKTMKPQLTLASVLEMERPVFEACAKDWHDVFATTHRLADECAKNYSYPLRFQQYLSANVGGNLQMGTYFLTLNDLCEKGVRMEAFRRQMRIMLALRRFELEHGALPDRPEELCPKYLPAVPFDPYDGKLMRWNAGTKVVYAVGEDQRDDGGKISRPNSPLVDFSGYYVPTEEDVGMYYWWKDMPK
jgi:hypothetical protein